MNFSDFLDLRLVTILSLIANFILAIIIFFKTALNEIFVEWWRDRKQQRIKKQEYYLQLRNTLIDFFKSTTILHLFLQRFYNLSISKNETLRGKKEEYSKKWGILKTKIENDELKFTPEIREKIKEYISVCQEQNAKIIDSDSPPQDLTEFSDIRESLEAEIIENVESEIPGY